jgi:hypothetical protein
MEKRMKKNVSASLLSLLLSLPVLMLTIQAQAAGFAGADVIFSNIEPDDAGGRDADVTALQFKFGSWLNNENTFAFEFRAALGLDDDKIRGTEVEIDRYYGTYLRGQFPKDFVVRPYGLLGLTRVETTEKPGGSENYNDLSLGIGAEMDITKSLFVSLEYLRVIDRSGDEISNLGLGIGGRF